MPDLKVEILDKHHPGFDRSEVDRHRALYEGGRKWRSMREQWLPQNAKEPLDVYNDRLKRAFYINHVGAIVDLITAFLFSEEVQVDGIEGRPPFEAMLVDTDGAGTSWMAWFQELFLEAQIGQAAYAWVNLPAREPGLEFATRADEEAAGALQPHLVLLRPEQVIDWQDDDRGRLVWVMVRSLVERRDQVDAPRSRVHRWTWIDGTQIRRWEWTAPSEDKPDPMPDDLAVELAPVTHGFGRLPVVRMELPSGVWALNKLHDPATALTRRSNDLDWSLHRAAHALMTIHSKWGDEDPTLGPGYFLKLGLEDRVEYAEPSGVSFDAQAAHEAALREELYRVVQQMAVSADADATRTRASGESKARDWQALEIVLSKYGELVRGVMREVLEVAAAARREELADLAVQGLDGWNLEDLPTFLQGALLGRGLVKSETFARVVAKRIATRLLQNEAPRETLDTIFEEIDAATYTDEPEFSGPTPPRTE